MLFSRLAHLVSELRNVFFSENVEICQIWPFLTSGDLIFDLRQNDLSISSRSCLALSNAVRRLSLRCAVFEIKSGRDIGAPPGSAKVAETPGSARVKSWCGQERIQPWATALGWFLDPTYTQNLKLDEFGPLHLHKCPILTFYQNLFLIFDLKFAISWCGTTTPTLELVWPGPHLPFHILHPRYGPILALHLVRQENKWT